MKHKIYIYRSDLRRRWYVECRHCDTNIMTPGPNGWYGRDSWDAALAIGIAHQKTYENGIRLHDS